MFGLFTSIMALETAGALAYATAKGNSMSGYLNSGEESNNKSLHLDVMNAIDEDKMLVSVVKNIKNGTICIATLNVPLHKGKTFNAKNEKEAEKIILREYEKVKDAKPETF